MTQMALTGGSTTTANSYISQLLIYLALTLIVTIPKSPLLVNVPKRSRERATPTAKEPPGFGRVLNPQVLIG